MQIPMKIVSGVAAGIGLALLASSACAQSGAYPTKPIRYIIPFPPGASTNDILGRAMAQRLSEALGQQIIVDNRPGAGGNLGSELASRAAPDGYTIVGGTNGPIAISPHLYSKLGYDPLQDLAPVALFAIVPYAIVAHPSVQATNVSELVALAKAQPGKLAYASAGNGSAPHLCMEMFKSLTGTDIVHVPYKGGAPASIDVLAGQVQLYCPGLTSVLQHVKAGRMKAITVTMAKRTPFLPAVSTSTEQGYPGLQVNSWVGILAPAKTPAAIVNRLHAVIAKAMATDEMKRVIAGNGAEPVVLGPKEFGDFLRGESEKWGKVVRAANLRID